MNEMIKAQRDAQQQLAIYSKIEDPLKFCVEMGKALQVTFGLSSPHAGTVMALTCLTESISPTVYNKRYHSDGSMRATSIQAEFMSRGGSIKWLNIGDDGKEAKAKFSHPTLDEPLELKYTIEDAKKQVGDKFSKDGANWKTNPGAMLRAALIRKAAKLIDPGIIGGYDPFDEFETAAKPQPKASKAVDAVQPIVNQEPIIEPVIDVAVEPASDPDIEGFTMQTEIAIPEPPPKEYPENEPVEADLLHEVFRLARKLPSTTNPGKGMTEEEIGERIKAACKVDVPTAATNGQILKLIERIKAKIG